MPQSLWLVPHDGNPFTKTVQELISDTVPRNFVSPQDIKSFQPHVVLISDIDGENDQAWLDKLDLPPFKKEHDEVLLELDTVEADDEPDRKMNISVKDNANLTKLAASCKAQATSQDAEKAQAWAQHDYHPCLSLLHADVPTRDVKGKVPLIEMKIGFAFGDLFACCGGMLCGGGHLALVDTSKSIDQAKIVAKRETPWAVWRATRNLI